VSAQDEAARQAAIISAISADFLSGVPVDPRPSAGQVLGPDPFGRLVELDLAARELDANAPLLLSPVEGERREARALHDRRAALARATRAREAELKAAAAELEIDYQGLQDGLDEMAEYDADTAELMAAEAENDMPLEDLLASIEAEDSAGAEEPDWGYGSW
jgi:hypothetical protein